MNHRMICRKSWRKWGCWFGNGEPRESTRKCPHNRPDDLGNGSTVLKGILIMLFFGLDTCVIVTNALFTTVLDLIELTPQTFGRQRFDLLAAWTLSYYWIFLIVTKLHTTYNCFHTHKCCLFEIGVLNSLRRIEQSPFDSDLDAFLWLG